ncbi:MAG: signal peptide peptidase SppA [Deltaproteobacteria bacterium]|nr:signal peptide peptidase SppA [Deltaproteobacteria bacterium]
MAKRHPFIKGLGILFLSILIFFVAVFFYAYLTGGEVQLFSLLGGEGVGVLQIEGSIDDSRGAIQNLKRFGKAKKIKAVVVRIDSPGGGVAPTQEIYQEIEKLKRKKPVIASLGGIAASGGYYIASACDQIVANPGTLTGSIGVIMELGNVEELMRKLGLKGYTIKSGPHKDSGSPLQPLSAEGRAILQSLVDNVHGQFVRAVAKGRRMPEANIRKFADGRVYSGEQAKELGLVDRLGSMEDAIDLADKLGGIKGVPQVIYSRSEDKSWWERLLFSFFGKGFGRGEVWGLRYEWSPYLIQ